MYKFVVIYRRVDDEEHLENFFSSIHLPLAEQLPGLVRSEVSRVAAKPGGESRFHLMYELYFAEEEHLYSALGSIPGRKMMSSLKEWADAKLVTWFFAHSWEEETQSRVEQS